MAQAILVRDKEGVISVWELQGSPMWSLWETRAAPTFSCNDDRENKRKEELNYYLDLIKNSGTVCDYTIKFHDDVPAGKKINNNTPIFGSLNFKLTEQSLMAPAAGAAGNNTGIAMMNELFAARLQNMEDKWERRLQDLERDHEDEIKEIEEEYSSKKGNKINGLLGEIGEATTQYPVFAELVKEWSTVIKHKFMQTFSPGGHAPAANIAGVNDNTPPEKVVQQAIQTLASYYVGKHGYFKEGITDAEKETVTLDGWREMAGDMKLLSGLTSDPDIFELAIKKLRQMS